MKILVCYSSNSLSNAIASSTMAKHEKENTSEFELERFNINKKSLRKHLNNEDVSKPEVIYVFSDDLQENWDAFELMRRENKNIKFITYNQKMLYKPVRQPGNTLKTRVYYLYDKILYDMENSFEKVPMYRVAISLNEIDIVHLHGFEANSPYAKRFMIEAYNCYHTKKEAREHLKERVYKSLDIKQKEIERFEKRVKVLKGEMETLEEEYHRVSAL